MKYEVIRTDTADEGIRKIILYVAQNFGNTVALEKLNQIEKLINRVNNRINRRFLCTTKIGNHYLITLLHQHI